MNYFGNMLNFFFHFLDYYRNTVSNGVIKKNNNFMK